MLDMLCFEAASAWLWSLDACLCGCDSHPNLHLCPACFSIRCTLEPKFIELGLVPFGLPKSFAVRLENVGSTPARFYFVAPPKLCESQDGTMVWDDSQPLCPPWLQISQHEGEVGQGACGLLALQLST